jgi:hypothetical protein
MDKVEKLIPLFEVAEGHAKTVESHRMIGGAPFSVSYDYICRGRQLPWSVRVIRRVARVIAITPSALFDHSETVGTPKPLEVGQIVRHGCVSPM